LPYSFIQPVVSAGLGAQEFSPTTTLPVAIIHGATWSSGVMPMGEFEEITVGITATEIVTATIQRYLDSDGLIPVGAAATAVTTATVATYCTISAINPALYFKVTIANAANATAVISAFSIAVQKRP
jgi:hypothetical protein